MITKKDKTCGKRLAHGYGMGKMMDVCYKKKLGPDDTVLVVRTPAELGSEWSVYEKIKSI